MASRGSWTIDPRCPDWSSEAQEELRRRVEEQTSKSARGACSSGCCSGFITITVTRGILESDMDFVANGIPLLMEKIACVDHRLPEENVMFPGDFCDTFLRTTDRSPPACITCRVDRTKEGDRAMHIMFFVVS